MKGATPCGPSVSTNMRPTARHAAWRDKRQPSKPLERGGDDRRGDKVRGETEAIASTTPVVR